MADQHTTEPPRPAQHLLESLEDGNFLADLDDQVTKLIATLAEHQRGVGGKQTGTLTIAVKITDDGKVLELAGSMAIATPKPIRSRSIMYRTRDNQLSRTHPQQMALPLQEADSPRGALRALP